MGHFDKQQILERVLGEIPVITNRRGEIESGGETRTIYAFYYNRGVPDPDLSYDRTSNPISTTADSTLCEIYSFWEGHPNVQELLQRLIREGEIEPGETLNQGPWLATPALNDEEVIRSVRSGTGYSYHHSASFFRDHFNGLCEELGYEPRLFDSSVQVARQSRLEVDGGNFPIDILVREPIGINLQRNDPSLSGVLDLIDEAYSRVVAKEIKPKQFVYQE